MSNWTNTNGGNWNDAGNWDAGIPDSTHDAIIPAGVLTAGKTITINAIANCYNLDISALDVALTLSNTTYVLNVYGNLVLPDTNLTVSFSGTAYLYFKATTTGKTITSGGVKRVWNRIFFDGVGGEWTNQDNWDVGISNTRIWLANGTWNTNNKNITCWTFDTSSGTKTLTLGSTYFKTDTWDLSNTTGLTFNVDTSTIEVTTSNFTTRGFTYYSVILSKNGSVNISGNYTNLTRISGTDGNVQALLLTGTVTVSGILTITSAGSARLMLLVASSVLGTPRTITVNGAVNISANCDFRDITFAGSAIPDFTSLEIGDCGGNGNNIYRVGETRYWHVGTGNYSNAKWYSQTNGGGSVKGMPLAQDTAIIDRNSFDATGTFTIDPLRIGSLDMSDVDDAVTLVVSSDGLQSYGGIILNSNITYSGNYTIAMMGRSSYNLNFAGKTIYDLTINAPNGTYSFTGNIVFRLFTQTLGNINLGSATLESNLITAATAWTYTSGNITPGTSIIKVNPASGSAVITLALGTKTYGNIWFSGSGTGSFNLTGSPTFADIKIDSGKTVKPTAGQTITFSSLTTFGSYIINSITAAFHTLVYTGTTPVEAYGGDITYSHATAGMLYAGSSGHDGGNNTGWIFGDFFTPLIMWM